MSNMNSDDKEHHNKENSFENKKTEVDYKKIHNVIQHVLEQALRDLTLDELKPGRSYQYGFNLHIKNDGTPLVEEFGKYPEKEIFSLSKIINVGDNEPFIDTVEYPDFISITAEVFGIKKRDLNIAVHPKKLMIIGDSVHADIYKTIKLPTQVNPLSIQYSLKNGVLDIELQKLVDNPQSI